MRILYIPSTIIKIVNNSYILFNSGDSLSRIYSYDPETKTTTYLFSSSGSSADIAHTENKLWVSGREFNITLNPFTYIPTGTSISAGSPGLCAITDNSYVDIYSQSVYEKTITPETSVFKFNMGVGRAIIGDYILTTTNKLITLNILSGIQRITQYSYPDGAIELDLSLSGLIGGGSAFGIYEYLSDIYIASYINAVTTKLYKIDKQTPYGITLFDTIPYGIYGASQIPSLATAHFELPI